MKLISLVLGCFLYSSLVFAAPALMLETKTFNEKSTSPIYKVEVQYPQIKSPTTAADLAFNHLAKQLVMQSVREFRHTNRTWDTHLLPAQIRNKGSILKTTFEATTIEPHQFISIRYSTDSYLVGAAHPSHRYQSLNYDLAQNRRVNLPDLFNPNSNYLQKLSQLSNQILSAKLQGKAMFKEGLEPKLKNFEVWNVTNDGIRITFNEYQVAPYVYGPQEVTISFSEIRDMMSPNTSVFNCFASKKCTISKFAPPAGEPLNL